MSYSHLVAQIEARIARLTAAREILASTLPKQKLLLEQASAEMFSSPKLPTPVSTAEPESTEAPSIHAHSPAPQVAEPAGDEPATSASPQAADAHAESVAITVLKAHRARERRTAPQRRPSLAPALTGPVPQAPVAISPRELAAARAAKAAPEPTAAEVAKASSALDELVREVKRRSA